MKALGPLCGVASLAVALLWVPGCSSGGQKPAEGKSAEGNSAGETDPAGGASPDSRSTLADAGGLVEAVGEGLSAKLKKVLPRVAFGGSDGKLALHWRPFENDTRQNLDDTAVLAALGRGLGKSGDVSVVESTAGLAVALSTHELIWDKSVGKLVRTVYVVARAVDEGTGEVVAVAIGEEDEAFAGKDAPSGVSSSDLSRFAETFEAKVRSKTFPAESLKDGLVFAKVLKVRNETSFHLDGEIVLARLEAAALDSGKVRVLASAEPGAQPVRSATHALMVKVSDTSRSSAEGAAKTVDLEAQLFRTGGGHQVELLAHESFVRRSR